MISNKHKLKKLNKILGEWNPIGVPDDISESEYSTYVPKLFIFKSDFLGLVNYLEFIITDEIGLNYYIDDIDNKKEVLYFAYKIFKVINN